MLSASATVVGGPTTAGRAAAYANPLYERLTAAGASEREARREVAGALGHGRVDVLRHYLILK